VGAPNPGMVSLVREYRGLTQAELAQRVGVTQGYLSKFENGVADIPAETVESLAAALDWPASFLYRPDARTGVGACVFHRKQSSVPMRTLRTVEATANILRIGLRPLLAEVDVGADFDFPVLGIEEYGGDVDRVAQLARAAWRLPYGPVVNLVGTVESAGGIVFRVPFGTRRFDAVSQWADHMPPVFLLNDVATPDRVRFSLAHEIGHVVMHSMPTPDMEREAHRFAAEFLMPAREIRGDLVNLDMAKAAALKQHWKVSMAALIYRARDLEVIPDWRAKAMFVELGRRGWRINEPGDVRIEEPSLAREIVDAVLVGDSIDDVSDQTGLPIRELMTVVMGERSGLRAVT
jgi:Zn-dependent peptidase ImmA (M78 family)/transcriptional regulator with XRE-family HTH domain